MGENIEPLDTGDGIFSQHPDFRQRLIDRFLLIGQTRVRIAFTLARLLERNVNVLALIIGYNALKTEIDQDNNQLKPG